MAVMLTRWRRDTDEDGFSGRLDSGIDDMEEGRELPLREAFRKISELRDVRRNART